MLAKIKKLELEAEVLEPNSKRRRQLAVVIEKYAEHFLRTLPTDKTYTADPINANAFRRLSISERSLEIAEILALLDKYVVKPGLNINAPGFLGFIPGGGLYASAWGDYLAAITNRFPSASFVSPGATRLENILIRWMNNLVGYPKSAGGNLASGGSIANLIGIVTARHVLGLKGKDFHRLVIYLSSQVHHSILKSLRIAGLEEAIIRVVPVDLHYCLDPIILNQLIKQDKKNKLIPWLIVASLGTTNTGSIDPLPEIIAIAKKHQLWVHVDAAYGGFFILCRSLKKHFIDLNQADSITIDPHKGLFVPYGLGTVLTKENNDLFKTHFYDEVDYFPDMDNEHPEFSPTNLSPELSKHFRALRLWLPLKLHGVGPFRAALNEKLLLSRYFYQSLSRVDHIEIACKPQLSIVTFRYCPPTGDSDQFNSLLSTYIKEEGKVCFSTTVLNNHTYLRMACLNFRTHFDTIALALDVLQHGIKHVLKA